MQRLTTAVVAIAAVGRVGALSISAELLDGDSRVTEMRRSRLEEWCENERFANEDQRRKLLQLQEIIIPNEEDSPDGSEVSATLSSLEHESQQVVEEMQKDASQAADTTTSKKKLESELKALEREVNSLKEVESQMSLEDQKSGHSWFFAHHEPHGLRALRDVLKLSEARLQSIHEKMNSSQTASLLSLSKEHQTSLKARRQKLTQEIATLRASHFAATSGRKMLDDALAETDATMADAASICGLGRSVLSRLEKQSLPLRSDVLELVGRVEGAASLLKHLAAAKQQEPQVVHIGMMVQAENPAPQVAPMMQPVQVQAPVVATETAAPRPTLVAVQKVTSAPTDNLLASASLAATKAPESAPALDMTMTEAPMLAQQRPVAVPVSKSSKAVKAKKQSLSELEDDFENEEPVKPVNVKPHRPDRDAKPPVPSTKKGAALISESTKTVESKTADDDDEDMSKVPSSFPAALRGGWKGLLAKKRAEKQTTPKLPDQATSIMQLMNTPATYTAWSPDDSHDVTKTATNKSEPLFDSLDDDEKVEKSVATKKTDARAFLQLQDGSHKSDELEEDLAGSNPPAFFQLDSSSESTVFQVASSIVPNSLTSMMQSLLEHFGKNLNSPSLLELSRMPLGGRSLEDLWQQVKMSTDKTQQERDRKAQEMCKERQAKQVSTSKKELDEEIVALTKLEEAKVEGKVLANDVATREEIAKAFGRASHRFFNLKSILQKEAAVELMLLQKLHQEVSRLVPEGAAAPEDVDALEAVVGRLLTVSSAAEQELEDAIAAIAARRSESELRSDRKLDALKQRLDGLEKKAAFRALGAKAISEVANADAPDEVCAMTIDSIQERLERSEGETSAVHTALLVLHTAALL